MHNKNHKILFCFGGRSFFSKFPTRGAKMLGLIFAEPRIYRTVVTLLPPLFILKSFLFIMTLSLCFESGPNILLYVSSLF